MKVGELVKYHNSAYPARSIGIVLEITDEGPCLTDNSYVPYPYRVRWTDHHQSQRDWYSKEELVKA